MSGFFMIAADPNAGYRAGAARALEKSDEEIERIMLTSALAWCPGCRKVTARQGPRFGKLKVECQQCCSPLNWATTVGDFRKLLEWIVNPGGVFTSGPKLKGTSAFLAFGEEPEPEPAYRKLKS